MSWKAEWQLWKISNECQQKTYISDIRILRQFANLEMKKGKVVNERIRTKKATKTPRKIWLISRIVFLWWILNNFRTSIEELLRIFSRVSPAPFSTLKWENEHVRKFKFFEGYSDD